jgi:hypothetical protein
MSSAVPFAWGIDVRPQLCTVNAGHLLDSQDMPNRNLIPLLYGLMRNAQLTGKVSLGEKGNG